jgi:two-component system, NarL family, nitrate/nitrite response regulator NarL
MIDPVFTPRLLIVAGELLARAGLAALLDPQTEFDIVGQISVSEDLPDQLDIYRPDGVLYDLGYEVDAPPPGLTALVDAGMPLVTLLPGSEAVAAVLALLNTGTEGYGLLMRETDAVRLTAALLGALNGLVTLDPIFVESLLPDEVAERPDPLMEDLTPREHEVLQYLARGLTNKAIAQILKISPNTVKFHINGILGKLNAQSRTEAVVRGTQLGLVIL